MESSKYRHDHIGNGLANYRGHGLITGCGAYNEDCIFKTEIMDMTMLQWSTGPDYPFAKKELVPILSYVTNITISFVKIFCHIISLFLQAYFWLLNWINLWCSIHYWRSYYKKCCCRVQRQSMASTSELACRKRATWFIVSWRSNNYCGWIYGIVCIVSDQSRIKTA